ncbi:hypothetical protein [Treponema pedis]|uniref:hypothetical protein n=1 Tax=Treponema pedis TaxID=409322 RepID=UPI003D231788
MLLRNLFRFLILASVLLFYFSSCSKKQHGSSVQNSQITDTTGTVNSQTKSENKLSEAWYYFSSAGELIKTESAEIAPYAEFLPWTEAVRVSSVAVMYEPSFFLVNKQGILPAFDFNTENSPAVLKSTEAAKRTAGGFYKTEQGLLVRFYTNTVFSSVNASDENVSLYRYNTVNNGFSPLIFPSVFKLEKEAQLVNLEFKQKWFASFKTEKNDRITFNYFSFDSFDEALKGNYLQISQDEVIKNTAPIDLNLSLQNEKLKEIAVPLKESGYKNIRAEFFSKNSKSKTDLLKQEDFSEEAEYVSACVCEFKSDENANIKKAVLFATGEMLLLDSEKQKWNKIELPQLPKNTVYTYFAIYGNTVIAAWEEQRFFEVGKTGLYVTSLPE